MVHSFKREGELVFYRFGDQSLVPQGSESNPAGFSYGVEYSSADIDAALGSIDPTSIVRHIDRSPIVGHGTHVAGIAAGDGSPANTFVGVAPEASIIAVSNSVTTAAFGDSSQTLDAVSYIFGKAESLDMPVVINLSQGDNIGPHDGTSLLERGIDNLLGSAGKIMVKSAGNEGSRNRHAMGTVGAGSNEEIGLTAIFNDRRRDNIIDIWYAEEDRFGFSVTPPGGVASATVDPSNTTLINLPNGNRVFVDSSLNDPNNNDNRIYLTVSRGTASAIERGQWMITLEGQTVTDGNFHAWIERSSDDPTFIFRNPHRSRSHTISIPGTSREVIAVGSYVTNGAGIGSLSSFSSRGPTRDGVQKPEISAPGQVIMSARAAGIVNGSGNYHSIPGTSMAAPHITGVIALMLEKNDNLTQQQVRDCLMDNARSDTFTGAVPNNNWGAGKVDALAAVNCVQTTTLIKFFDDGGTPNKFADDGGTPIKFFDDGGTPNKFADDGGTPIKFFDDGGTPNKFADDGGSPSKAFDDVKQPALDKSPFTDRGRGKLPIVDAHTDPRTNAPNTGGDDESEAAPFILSVPHHSMAWTNAYPAGASQQELSRYEQAIREYETILMQFKAGVEEGTLTQQEHAQLTQLDQEYRAILSEYQKNLKAAGLA